MMALVIMPLILVMLMAVLGGSGAGEAITAAVDALGC